MWHGCHVWFSCVEVTTPKENVDECQKILNGFTNRQLCHTIFFEANVWNLWWLFTAHIFCWDERSFQRKVLKLKGLKQQPPISIKEPNISITSCSDISTLISRIFLYANVSEHISCAFVYSSLYEFIKQSKHQLHCRFLCRQSFDACFKLGKNTQSGPR